MLFSPPGVFCPLPVPPAHGRLLSVNTLPGSCVSHQCEAGYTLVGHNKRRCLDSGEWGTPRPQCCEYIPLLLGARSTPGNVLHFNLMHARSISCVQYVYINTLIITVSKYDIVVTLACMQYLTNYFT